jgi:hypothetical protein
MQKCRKDQSLKLDENETFMAPPGISLNLDCDGSDADASVKEQADELIAQMQEAVVAAE